MSIRLPPTTHLILGTEIDTRSSSRSAESPTPAAPSKLNDSMNLVAEWLLISRKNLLYVRSDTIWPGWDIIVTICVVP